MLLKTLIIVAHLISACLGFHPLSQNDSTTTKPFVCGSRVSSQAIRKEKKVSSSSLATRSFLLSRDDQWPRGYVPYEIDSAFSKKQVLMIQSEMRKISHVSCVRWVRRNNQRDYVSIRHTAEPGSCSAVVGRMGGAQALRLNGDCFDVKKGYQGAILHEMMHALGFIHEQQRLDRDCYVRVVDRAVVIFSIELECQVPRRITLSSHGFGMTDTIQDPSRHDNLPGMFVHENSPADYATVRNTSVDFPYDFGSIMQYGASDEMKSKNGEKLGNFEGELTHMDIMKLNFMYCKGKSFCELQPSRCQEFRLAELQCLKN